MSSAKLRMILGFAKNGIPVLPLVPGAKTPAVSAAQHLVQSRPIHPVDECRELRRRQPCALTLNVLLSFAQFERELSSERVRDKVAASRKKGKWTGGSVPLG